MTSPRPTRSEYFPSNFQEQFHLPPSPLPEPQFEPLSSWTEFARYHSRSPPIASAPLRQRADQDVRHSHIHSVEQVVPQPTIDLRALEYVSEYDTNLMCPICHVPFIEPIVLDCDHTFCGDCFEEYHQSGSGTERSRCPACRAYQLGGSRRANRLIRNMASEVRVKCPNSGCETVLPRSSMQVHATRECPEQEISCPAETCDRQTKRKNFVPDTCIHETHIECDCGATIRLGRGEWIRHKDEQCPNTVTVTSQHPQEDGSYQSVPSTCPGASYGCKYEALFVDNLDISSHVSICPLASLAPFLQKQESFVKTLQRSLDQQSRRNEILEAGFNNLHDIVVNTIQPRLDHLYTTSNGTQNSDDNASELEIEEIPRSPVPHRQTLYSHENVHYAQPDPVLSSTLSNLTERLSTLENQHHADTFDTHRAIRDLDARTSLALMNETLRIREELAHLNGGMYSTRAQVNYLLNHHRIAGQQAALNAGTTGVAAGVSNLARGLSNALNNTSTTGASNTSTNQPASQIQNQTQPQAIPVASITSVGINAGASSSGTSGGVASAGTSPTLNPILGTTRPVFRRGSAGSASGSRSSVDRVKL